MEADLLIRFGKEELYEDMLRVYTIYIYIHTQGFSIIITLT